MKKTTILTVIIIGILILLAAFLLALKSSNLQPSNYPDLFSYTKAICNKNNFCRDYKISCEGKNILKISPITGATIKFSPDWKDPRDEETIKKGC
jgi:hypothetical protein